MVGPGAEQGHPGNRRIALDFKGQHGQMSAEDAVDLHRVTPLGFIAFGVELVKKCRGRVLFNPIGVEQAQFLGNGTEAVKGQVAADGGEKRLVVAVGMHRGDEPGIFVEPVAVAPAGIDVAHRRAGAETHGQQPAGKTRTVRLRFPETRAEKPLGSRIVDQKKGQPREMPGRGPAQGLIQIGGRLRGAARAHPDRGHAPGLAPDHRIGQAQAKGHRFGRKRAQGLGYFRQKRVGQLGQAAGGGTGPGLPASGAGQVIAAGSVQSDQPPAGLVLADIDRHDRLPAWL